MEDRIIVTVNKIPYMPVIITNINPKEKCKYCRLSKPCLLNPKYKWLSHICENREHQPSIFVAVAELNKLNTK